MIASMLVLTSADAIALKITDTYSIHRIVYDLFDDIRSKAEKCASVPSGILYVDKGGEYGGREILVLSNRVPNKPSYGTLKSQSIPETLLTHGRYRFEVMLNPTRRDSKTGKTIGVHGYEAIVQWFIDKAPTSWGFAANSDSLRVEDMHVKKFNKSQGQVTMASATLIGELEVIDLDKFISSFRNGIGRGRAFGFGLLQIIPLTNNLLRDV